MTIKYNSTQNTINCHLITEEINTIKKYKNLVINPIGNNDYQIKFSDFWANITENIFDLLEKEDQIKKWSCFTQALEWLYKLFDKNNSTSLIHKLIGDIGEIVSYLSLSSKSSFIFHNAENSQYDFTMNNENYDIKTTTFNKKTIILKTKQLEANILVFMFSKKEQGLNIIQLLRKTNNLYWDRINIFWTQLFNNGYADIINQYKVDKNDILFIIDKNKLPIINQQKIIVKQITILINENDYKKIPTFLNI